MKPVYADLTGQKESAWLLLLIVYLLWLFMLSKLGNGDPQFAGSQIHLKFILNQPMTSEMILKYIYLFQL